MEVIPVLIHSLQSINYFQRKAFTLVELIATLAIIAALVAILIPFISGMVSYARQTGDKQTLTVLNDALTRYKCEGGDVNALTASAPIASVIARLQADTTWAGLTHSFLQKGKTYIGRSIYAKGAGHQYRFTKFNTYEAETGGTSPTSLTNGLVGWWKFDEGSGATATDSSPGGNSGTIIGAAWNASGKHGGCLNFDGSDDYVDLGDLGVVENQTALTVSAWVKNNKAQIGSTGPESVISKEGSGNDTFTFSWWQDENVAFGIYNLTVPTYGLFTDGILDGTQWHLVTGVYDSVAGTVSVYVDGVKGETIGSLSIPTQNTVHNLRIGFPSDSGWQGLIDDVRIYNRALSADEVLQLYQQ